MARAGFYAVESRKIRFGRDGQWYSDDERIANDRITRLFSRSIRRHPDGGYMLQIADEKARIEVDDTPFVVRQVFGNAEEGFTVVLNDETEEPLDPTTLRAGPDSRGLYCRVKNGEHEARFLRSAYYDLARWIREADRRGFLLTHGKGEFPVREP